MSISSIGRIVSRQNVEQTVVKYLQTWLVSTYLPEVEAQNSIAPALPRPPSEESYYGGVDDQTWEEDWLPVLVVTAEPVEDAIRLASSYQQWFEVKVTNVVFAEDEASARSLSDWYGAAVMATITESLNLDGFASDLILIETPVTAFVEEPPDRREFAQATTTFRMLVNDVVTESGRPASPGWPPPPPFEAQTTSVEVDAVPVDEPLTSP